LHKRDRTKYGRLKTLQLHHMPRNTIGHMQG